MVVSSYEEFADAVRTYRFDEPAFDRDMVARARGSLAATRLLVVGEWHGVYETPSALASLAVSLDTRAVAFEWSHEEMDEPLQRFLHSGRFDFEHLWSLPDSAEFFCGDGRIAAGHFALLQRLAIERRLEQVIAFDRLDPEPLPDDPSVRDREMAARLLGEWDDRIPLLVLTGAAHARLDAGDVGADGTQTMAMHLARRRPRLQSAMLEYDGGSCWSRGRLHDVSGPMPPASIALRLPVASPAVVPGPAGA